MERNFGINIKCYKPRFKNRANTFIDDEDEETPEKTIENPKRLTTKKAVELLMDGTLKQKVCRYCLTIAYPLSELDQILEVSVKGVFHKLTIRNMIACFHPYKRQDYKDLPNKICNRCLNRVLTSYLFTQQCDQSERALHNCLQDVYNKMEKLDPLERTKKRGRQKANPNYNVIYTEHERVIDYAEPAIKLVKTDSHIVADDPQISDLECPRCWELFPDMETLWKHSTTHDKTMWYNCRLCGQSFPKQLTYKRHIKAAHSKDTEETSVTDFKCNTCDAVNTSYRQHLEHMEKHKFKMVLQHLLDRKMDKLCAVCFNKRGKMMEMKSVLQLHGGFPEITGDRSIEKVLSSVIPEMHFHNFSGTKICEVCLNHAMSSYIFTLKTKYVRNRLANCISNMIKNLEHTDDTKSNLLVVISKNILLGVSDEDLVEDNEELDDVDELDDTKYKVEELEDEFRVSSEGEESSSVNASSDEVKTEIIKGEVNDNHMDDFFGLDDIGDNYSGWDSSVENENPAKRARKTYVNRKIFNGYKRSYSTDSDVKYEPVNDVCNEFLTFKKKRRPSYKCKFTCPICDKNFISEYFLEKHILKHSFARVSCLQCGIEFKSKFELSEHVKVNHISNRTNYIICYVCKRAFFDENKYKLHEKNHFNKQCQLCNKVFSTQQHFDAHLRRHVSKFNQIKREFGHNCSFCEIECRNENKLSLHVNKVHLQIKPYNCDMCDRQFYTEHMLEKHKEIHSIYSKEQCNFCSKKLKCRRDLVVHIRRHIGIKPFCCQICNQRFYSETKLRNHMRQYHGGRFVCKLCKSAFVSRSEMKSHIDIVHSVF